MKWIKITVETTCEAVDLLSAFLDEEGVLGVQIEDHVPLTDEELQEMFVDLLPDQGNPDDGSARISCFTEDAVQAEELTEKIKEELIRLSQFVSVGSGSVTTEVVEDEDWLHKWKAFFKAFRLYDNIIIKPTWEELPQDRKDDDIVIEIDPGISFGTGAHETTRLCIGQLKKYLTPNASVFDVGSGSGILSIISSLLGAGFVFGMDIDETAVRTSIENAELNHIESSRLTFACGNLLAPAASAETAKIKNEIIEKNKGKPYDIVVANILADVIIPLAEVISPYIKENGYFITSGIISRKEEEVKHALCTNGFRIVEIVHMNDWVSITAQAAEKKTCTDSM